MSVILPALQIYSSTVSDKNLAAGILSNKKCVQTDPKEWHRVFYVNVDGPFYFAQAVLPIMR